MKSPKKDNSIRRLILSQIRNHRTFLICSHSHPDGDATGSQLALGIFLIEMGKDVVLFNRDGVPETYRFLPFADRMVRDLKEGRVFDCTFLLDCAHFDRVQKGFGQYPGKGKAIVIDHHALLDGEGDIQWIEPRASSTAELLFSIIQDHRGGSISQDIAINLYTALLTDTGSFQFSNTTPRAFEMARALLKSGADPRSIAERVYERYPAQRFRLLSRVLDTLELRDNGAIALITATRSMIQEAHATEEMTDNFVNFPRSIDGVEVAVFLRESSDGLVKVSLRSRGEIDVAAMASRFHGGGHFNAAGCLVRGDLEEVKGWILDALHEALEGRV